MRFAGNGRLYDYGDIIRLPKKAQVLVVSDIHGNYDDFMQYVDLWKNGGKDCHIVFMGDLIHGLDYEKDKSLDILKKIYKLDKNNNFHVLMGNHEFFQLFNKPIFKNGINQTEEFKAHFFRESPITFGLCNDLIKSFKKIAITPNGLLIAHSGPSRLMTNILKEINSGISLTPFVENAYINEAFEDMSFSRYPEDYTVRDIDEMLKVTNTKAMIVGHTPVNGYRIIGNQIIMDSSFETENKYFLSMSTEEEINDIKDVERNLVLFEG